MTHWLDGIRLVRTCLIGCPDSFLGIVGSSVALRARLPNAAKWAECVGERSLAYTTWQAEQPLDR